MKNIQRIAIITGITKGIGEAIAESLAARRINLVGVSRNEKNITELFERLCSKHKIDCLAVQTDVSQNDQVNTLIMRTLKRFGRIDILVNNAAVGAFDSIVDSKLDDWQKMIDINLKSVYLCSKAVLPQMMRQKNGIIINISSVCGLRGYSKCGTYCASKFGVNGLTEVLALEAKPSDIKVFDGKINREKIEESLPFSLSFSNPPGTIQKDAWSIIEKAIKENKNVFVDGEEDLLVIPAVLLSKDHSAVVYGFFNKGICLIEVSDKIKNTFKELLKKFN